VTAISSARAQRRMGLVVWIQVAQCLLALALMWLLLPTTGMVGAGLAWLVTQLVIACGLLIRRDLWLKPAPGRSGPSPMSRWISGGS
jgi:O-antigen/teichoic acid export membrane protein